MSGTRSARKSVFGGIDSNRQSCYTRTMKKNPLFYKTEDGQLARTMNDEDYVLAANAQYGDEGTIEIDDGAKVSRGSDHGAYVQAWVWISDEVPSDGSAPDGSTLALTEKQVNRIEQMLGRLPDADMIESAILENKGSSRKALQASLRSLEATFGAAGGRGVENADEIDKLRIALAVRPLRKGEYIIPAPKQVKQVKKVKK